MQGRGELRETRPYYATYAKLTQVHAENACKLWFLFFSRVAAILSGSMEHLYVTGHQCLVRRFRPGSLLTRRNKVGSGGVGYGIAGRSFLRVSVEPVRC